MDDKGVYRHHLLVVKSRTEEDFEKGRKEVIDVLSLRREGKVLEETFDNYPGKFRKHQYYAKYTGEEAITWGRRVMAVLEKKPHYDLVTFNCEHFVRMVRTGKSTSRQVKRAFYVLIGVLVGGVIGNVGGSIVGGAIAGAIVGAVVGGVSVFAVDYAYERFSEDELSRYKYTDLQRPAEVTRH